MASKRMFSKQIIDSDPFLDMALSTQALYFHLCMRADDDGFINNPKRIIRLIGCNDDELKLLIAKNFVIPFESGVCVIKHWMIHNYIQKDRYKETVYKDEKRLLGVKDNKAYTLMNTNCIQSTSNMDTKYIQSGYILDTDSIQNVSSEKMKNGCKPSKIEGSEQCVQHGYNMDTNCTLRLDKISIDKSSIDKDRVEENSLTNSTSILSFPTSTHELLFNQFGKNSYITWFESSHIEVKGELIVISVDDEFKKKAIVENFLNYINLLTHKKVSVKVKGAN